MSQSVVDACNSALQKLGAARILTITDNSREARECEVAFDSNRRSELRKQPWKFAIKRIQLAPDAQIPAFDFKHQFTLPADCLRVIFPADAYCDWVVEGRKILSNDSVVNLRYIADITDLTLWASVFYDLFCISLAIDMCEPITNSTSKKAQLQNEYLATLAEAGKANMFEQLPVEAQEDSLWLVRL